MGLVVGVFVGRGLLDPPADCPEDHPAGAGADAVLVDRLDVHLVCGGAENVRR